MGSEVRVAAPKPKFKAVPLGEAGEGLTRFCRIELSLLEEDILLFDLYLFAKEHGELIPFMSIGSTFSLRIKEELLDRGIDALYVPTKDKRVFDAFVESRLPTLLKSNIPPRRKLELTYSTAKQIMEDVFTDYCDKQNIQRAKGLVSSIVELFASEREDLSRYLIDLTVHDYSTYTHSLHVCLYGTATALRMYSNEAFESIKQLSFGFLMHDIGKTRIDPDILKKPGKLNDEEWREVKKHPWWGYGILEDMKELTADVATIVLQHHERLDGTGYPSGLKGHEMGTLSRICAFSDVFDAITTERPYQEAMPTYDALTFIRDEMKSLNDRKLFEVFVKLFAEE